MSFIGSKPIFESSAIQHHRADVPDHERVAVRLRPQHLAQADHAVGTGLVFDHDRLVELSAQAVGDQPARQVGDTGRRKRNEQFDRTARIGILSECRARQRHTEQQ
jgi:hypothetical protein